MTGMTEQVGSPPLTRGIPGNIKTLGGATRFTPAHAGNTESVPAMFLQAQVHPRSRGEYAYLMVQEAINLFADVVAAAIPYAVVFALGQRLVTMFLGMAFKGHVEL